jgi:peptide deformylase
MIKSIVTNEEKLALHSDPINFNWPENEIEKEGVKGFVIDLLDTAGHHQKKPIGCLGLAANQIGYLYRIVAVWHADDWLVMINPEIELIPGMSNYMREGCLSRPGVRTKLQRHKKIRIKYQDTAGVVINRKFTGMAARVIQHEVDHLNGIYI